MCRRVSKDSTVEKNIRKPGLRLYRFDWDHAFQLRHNTENLGIQGPVIQVCYGAFEERGHAGTTCLDVPVMTSVICIWPYNANRAYQRANRELLGMLDQKSPDLRPVKYESMPLLKSSVKHTMEQDRSECHMATHPACPSEV